MVTGACNLHIGEAEVRGVQGVYGQLGPTELNASLGSPARPCLKNKAKRNNPQNQIQMFLGHIDPIVLPGMMAASLSCVEVGVCAGPQVGGLWT